MSSNYDPEMGTPIPGTDGFYMPANLPPDQMDAFLKRLRSGSLKGVRGDLNIKGTPQDFTSNTSGYRPGVDDVGTSPEFGSRITDAVAPQTPEERGDLGPTNSSMRVMQAMKRMGPGNPAPDTSPFSAARAKWADLGLNEPGTPPENMGPMPGTPSSQIQPENETEAQNAAATGWAPSYEAAMKPVLSQRAYEKQLSETEQKKSTAEDKGDTAEKVARIRAAADVLRGTGRAAAGGEAPDLLSTLKIDPNSSEGQLILKKLGGAAEPSPTGATVTPASPTRGRQAVPQDTWNGPRERDINGVHQVRAFNPYLQSWGWKPKA